MLSDSRIRLFCRSTKVGGTSLVELAVSFMLITLITSFGMLSFCYINRYFVRSDLERLCTLCFYLQQRARITSKHIELKFDVQNNVCSYLDKKVKLNGNSAFGLLSGIKGPPSSSTRLISKPITFPECKIIFTPNGIMRPGSIYLTDSQKTCQYALTIAVSQVSFLRKYVWRGAWQKIS